MVPEGILRGRKSPQEQCKHATCNNSVSTPKKPNNPHTSQTIKPAHFSRHSETFQGKLHTEVRKARGKSLLSNFWFGSSSRKKEKEKVIDADMEELLNLAWIQLSATEESDSTIPDPSHQTVMSTPPVIAPFTVVHLSKPSLLAYSSTNQHGKLPTITISPEITPYIGPSAKSGQRRRLEQEMSEVKKTDHSADVVASIKSQVPMAVDKYLGTKLDDALLKVLERHTADLIEKYSVLPGPESVKNQESEKSPKEIIRAKQEQGEEKQDSTYSIRSTDTVDLEEFDLKNEDAMDKEVEDKVKDHKRKHDSDDDEDDDDDEGPLAGSNQGNSAKRRRHV
ncbi:hypothetical protein Tco_1402178 [Tanacetum coccineum]